MNLFAPFLGERRRNNCGRPPVIRECRVCGDAGLVKVTKSSNYVNVTRGEEVEVRIDVANVSAVPMQVLIEDAFKEAWYVPDSTAINGVATPNANPMRELNLGVIAPSEVVTIHYRCVVCESSCSPACAWYTPENSDWQGQIAEACRSNILCIHVQS